MIYDMKVKLLKANDNLCISHKKISFTEQSHIHGHCHTNHISTVTVIPIIYPQSLSYQSYIYSHCHTNHISTVTVIPIKHFVSFNCAISQYIPQHFTFHNIILLILRHYGEGMGIHSCKCIHQMGASKWVQIQRTEPHWLLAIYSPAFYVAHHRVWPIAC